jgi:hypothetical protein
LDTQVKRGNSQYIFSFTFLHIQLMFEEPQNCRHEPGR